MNRRKRGFAIGPKVFGFCPGNAGEAFGDENRHLRRVGKIFKHLDGGIAISSRRILT